MKKIGLLIFSFVLFIQPFAQTPADDEITLRAASDWLDRKLSFNYYDRIDEKWWVNNFYLNENREVSIKNIAAKNPNSVNIKSKTYTEHRFSLEDINPDKIEIFDIDEPQGRIVKGKLIELHTYGNKQVIKKRINGKVASNNSFVFIVIPDFLMDSVPEYAALIRTKFMEAIQASTKVYNQKNDDANKKTIFRILYGNYADSNGENIEVNQVYGHVMQLKGTENEMIYFGYDDQKNMYYLNKVSPAGAQLDFYQLADTDYLRLVNTADSKEVIEFNTLNSFSMKGTDYNRR